MSFVSATQLAFVNSFPDLGVGIEAGDVSCSVSLTSIFRLVHL